MAQGLWKTRKGSCNNVIHEDLSIKACPPSFWRGVLGKSGCWKRNANHSLSVTLMEPHGQARDNT